MIIILSIVFFIPLLQGLFTLILSNRSYRLVNLILAIIYLLVMMSLFTFFSERNELLADFLLDFTAISLGSQKIITDLFFLDFLSYLMILMVAVVMFCISLWQYNKTSEKFSYGWLYFAAFTLIGLFTSRNALLMYIFWELSVLPVFVGLLVIAKNRAEHEIALRFFLYTFSSSMLMMIGLIYLYWSQLSGEFNFNSFQLESLIETVQLNALSETQLWYLFLWMIIAVGVKIPIFPLHSWQPDTYVMAPLSIVQFTGALLGKMGIYVLLRWYLPIFEPIWHMSLYYVFYPFSIATMFLGYLLAWRENNMKRLLAYYSLGHTSLIVLGIVVLEKNALNGSLLQIVGHGLLIIGLFAIAEKISERAGSMELGSRNLRNRDSAIYIYLLLLTLASIALPLTMPFVGEVLIVIGLFRTEPLLIFPSLLGLILGAAVMLRLIRKSMSGPNSHENDNQIIESKGEIAWNEHVFFVFLIGVFLFFGLFPKILTDPMSGIWKNLTNL